MVISLVSSLPTRLYKSLGFMDLTRKLVVVMQDYVFYLLLDVDVPGIKLGDKAILSSMPSIISDKKEDHR